MSCVLVGAVMLSVLPFPSQSNSCFMNFIVTLIAKVLFRFPWQAGSVCVKDGRMDVLRSSDISYPSTLLGSLPITGGRSALFTHPPCILREYAMSSASQPPLNGSNSLRCGRLRLG